MHTTNDDENDLVTRMDQVAKTLHEKIAVLDARDKVIRLRRERQTDIQTAKAVLGTCPDMCPEYERYFREDTNQLSSLEMRDGRESDPYAMVKEYRRAGADQEEPLPHELRPPAVLLRTMDHLVCNVMDRFEADPSTAGDWYDFIWSRLRAIRKDITQQHLCDEASVELMEKCARFHIYCAHAMCEEDTTVFDQKINNENLSKCIQSLKDFYHDLSLKGVTCENEAEFRCYDILLHLQDSDIMQKLKHVPKELRDTGPVNFAFAIYYAFISNNFIKFFKLVHDTTYLNSCILHRYFNHMRFQAVKILQKSYSIPNQAEQYPADQLMIQLGFNDSLELHQFCDAVGLSFTDQHIMLTREKGIENLADVPTVRAQRLIERKRSNVCVGEIVNASALPENPYKRYPLHDSFDSSGKLKRDAIDADDQRQKTQENNDVSYKYVDPPDSSREFHFQKRLESTLTTPVERKPMYSDRMIITVITELAEKIFSSTLRSLLLDVFSQVVVNAKTEVSMIHITNEVLSSLIKDVSSKVYNDVKCEWDKQLQLNAISRISEELTEKIIQQETFTISKAISKDVYYSEYRKYILTQSSLYLSEILEETVRKAVSQISEQCYREAVDEREKLVASIRAKRQIRIAKKYSRKWRIKCIYARRYRYFKENFPASNIDQFSPSAKLLQLPNASTKRKMSEDVSDTSSKQMASESNYVMLFPKRYAESVYSLTQPTFEDVQCRPNLEKLRREIDEEKESSQRFLKTLELLKRSFAFSEDDTNEKT